MKRRPALLLMLVSPALFTGALVVTQRETPAGAFVSRPAAVRPTVPPITRAAFWEIHATIRWSDTGIPVVPASVRADVARARAGQICPAGIPVAWPEWHSGAAWAPPGWEVMSACIDPMPRGWA